MNLRGLPGIGTASRFPPTHHDRHVHHACLGPVPDSTCLARRCAPNPRPSRCITNMARCSGSRWCSWSRGVLVRLPALTGVEAISNGCRLSEGQVPQRRDDVAAAWRRRGVVIHWHHHAGQGDRGEGRRQPGAADRRAARLPPENADHPAGRRRVPRFPDRPLADSPVSRR